VRCRDEDSVAPWETHKRRLCGNRVSVMRSCCITCRAPDPEI